MHTLLKIFLATLVRVLLVTFLVIRTPELVCLLPDDPIPLKQQFVKYVALIFHDAVPASIDWNTFRVYSAIAFPLFFLLVAKSCGSGDTLLRDARIATATVGIVTGLMDHWLLWQPSGEKVLLGQVALITGGSSGIGWHTALGLHRLGANVVVTCRSAARCEKAVAKLRRLNKQLQDDDGITSIVLDLSSPSSIRACAAEFRSRFDRLDVLVLNAGAIAAGPSGLTEDGLEYGLGTMHIGHAHLFHLLQDLVLHAPPLSDDPPPPARVVLSSSGAHLLGRFHPSLTAAPDGEGDLRGEHTPGEHTPACCLVGCSYCRAKLANVLYARELARRYPSTAAAAAAAAGSSVTSSPDDATAAAATAGGGGGGGEVGRGLIAVSVSYNFVATDIFDAVAVPAAVSSTVFPVLMRSPEAAALLALKAAAAPAAEVPSGAFLDALGRPVTWRNPAGIDSDEIAAALGRATDRIIRRREADASPAAAAAAAAGGGGAAGARSGAAGAAGGPPAAGRTEL